MCFGCSTELWRAIDHLDWWFVQVLQHTASLCIHVLLDTVVLSPHAAQGTIGLVSCSCQWPASSGKPNHQRLMADQRSSGLSLWLFLQQPAVCPNRRTWGEKPVVVCGVLFYAFISPGRYCGHFHFCCGGRVRRRSCSVRLNRSDWALPCGWYGVVRVLWMP